MKVLVLATDAFGGYGGIAQYNQDFIHALCRIEKVQSVEVIVRLGSATSEVVPEKAVQHAPVRSRIGYARRAFQCAMRSRPDIVVSAHLYHGPLALGIARLCRASLISQLHGTEVWGGLSPRHRRPLESSDAVLCVSRDTRARLLQQANLNPQRVLVVPNTVGLEFMPADRSKARRRLGLSNEHVILTVARLDGRQGYKGHDRVLKTLPDLKQKFSEPVVYLIAGDGEDRGRLEALSQSLAVSSMVRFLGKVSHDELPDLYRAADIFALPSTGEGFGIVFLEAMSCGTPAIGLSVGGAPDALGDGELGHCVTELEFPSRLLLALQAERPDPSQLHAAVQARFGKAVFDKRVGEVFSTIRNRMDV